MQTTRPRTNDKRGNKNGIPKKKEKGIVITFCKSMNLEINKLANIDNPKDAPKDRTIETKPLKIDSFKYIEHISDSLAPKQLNMALVL